MEDYEIPRIKKINDILTELMNAVWDLELDELRRIRDTRPILWQYLLNAKVIKESYLEE